MSVSMSRIQGPCIEVLKERTLK